MKNSFEEKIERNRAEARAAIEHRNSHLSYAERDKIRRSCRRKMLFHTSTVAVQTYRVWITLECGHKTTFTMSANYYKAHAHDWMKPRKECGQCGDAAEKEAEAKLREGIKTNG